MSTLNNEQLQAVNSDAKNILCLAGAGAGKTKTMLDRISRLVTDGVAPSSILALTFTNAAAAEMKSRYEKLNLGAETPEFRTFHSFCYSVLCKDADVRSALGYITVPAIASEEQVKAIKEKARAQCKITMSDEKMKKRDLLPKKDQYQIDLYLKAVKRLMQSEGIITFDELNSEVAALFAEDNPATDKYKDKYKHLFVDEFQDTDCHQVSFLNSFPNTNFYYCGDCLQNIYSFRGTSNEYIKELSTDDHWEKIRLFTNYRSTNQICAYANSFSESYADESYRIEMQGIRDGEDVVIKPVGNISQRDCIDKSDIADVLREKNKLQGTTAILCRTNKEVSAVIEYLSQNGIDYTTGRSTKVPQLLDCTLSDTYMLGWLASYLSSNKYGEYIRLSSQVENPDLYWFLRIYGGVQQIADDVRIIMSLRAIASSTDSMEDKLKLAATLLGLKSIELPNKDYFGAEFLQYLKDAVTTIKSSELYVGTVHSVKGLEYDNVFVMNAGTANFPLYNEDMMNLFYVAITRAKNRLYVYRADNTF